MNNQLTQEQIDELLSKLNRHEPEKAYGGARMSLDPHGDWIDRDELIAALKALAAAPQPPAAAEAGEDVFCWLVELRPAFEGHPPFQATYYAGWMEGCEAAQTTDPYATPRFTRKADAEAVAAKLGHTLSCTWQAVQHGFHAAPTSSRAKAAGVDERAAFEADTLEAQPLATFNRFPSGRYNVDWIEHQWCGWQRRAALAATPSEAAPAGQSEGGAGWLPIETALKDGTHILAWSEDKGARETHWRFYGEGSIARERFKAGDGPSGAWDWTEPHNNWSCSWEPTHWKPLPAAPAKEGGGNA